MKLLLFIPLILVAACHPQLPELDIIISDAIIIDGTGREPYRGFVGIAADTIAYISTEPYEGPRDREINAAGRVIAPGFIDLHAHGNPLKTPEFENFLAMGVTTIVLGQDGSSPISTLPEWKFSIDSIGAGVNVAMMLGHGSLRSAVGVRDSITRIQLQKMLELLEEYMPYTFGMSTGLEYTPGLYASPDELHILASRVGGQDKLIMSHMRNEDDDELLTSLHELAQQGQHCQVHIAHLKSVYGKGKERAGEILAFIDSIRSAGVRITGDIYPYTASYTGISILFPDWCKTNEQFEVVRQSRRSELHAYLTRRIRDRNGPDATLFGTDPYTGRTLGELSEELDIDPADFLIEYVGPEGASGAYFIMDEELQEYLLRDPFIAVCSDGSPTGFHPRGHGTFARIIEEFVVNRNALTLEEAIRKMTSLPADILAIHDRGKLETGLQADLVIFEPELVKEKATYSDPLRLSEGFDFVIVNGKIAREASQIRSLNGRYLLKQGQ